MNGRTANLNGWFHRMLGRSLFATCFLIAINFLACIGIAEGPTGRGEIHERIRKSIGENDSRKAIQAMQQLPMNERWEWIEPISQIQRSPVGSRSSSLSATASDSAAINSRDATGNSTIGLAEAGKGAAGGGTTADFSSLMQLIMSTVDSNWELDGGEDTLMPYFSGVWIDPHGAIKTKSDANVPVRKVTSEQVSIELPKLGEWQKPTDLRWISINRLQDSIAQIASEKQATVAMKLLGGLTRIDYVAWDAKERQWLLGGPAGGLVLDGNGELLDPKTQLPPVLLEDLMSVAPHVLNRKGVLGCSIEPVAQRLADAYRWLEAPGSRNRLAKEPRKWTDDLKRVLGPQRVGIAGLPENSPSGLALLLADQHMKRLGLGLEKGIPGVPDYLAQCKRLKQAPDQGLVRWWFAINKQPVVSNREQTFFVMPKNSVQVLSEQEWMDQTGKRASTGKRDPAADAFAESFTEHFNEIQSKYPVYGRLRHIIDLSIAFEIIRRSEAQNSRSELDLLHSSHIQPHLERSPKWVDTIATHRSLGDLGMVAIASGGVVMSMSDLRLSATQGEMEIPKLRSSSSASSEWWQDP